MSDSRTALVTGASSGIGAAVARLLAERGYTVYGTSRNPATAPSIAGVTFVALDLESTESIEKCFEEVGEVDVLVNNAGESQSGPLEELPMAALERLFQLNVFGAIRLTQLVLPGMRRRGYGRVVMIGSMLGSFPLAFRSSYVATKAAIKGFATAARRELAPYGVAITTVEPGAIATGIGTRRTHHLADGSPYTAEYDTMIEHLDANERGGIAPRKVAQKIVAAIESDSPRELYAIGSGAPAVFVLQRLLPRTVVTRLVARRHGL
nr:SDR family oxidoreductase [Rhodococcus rhodnii]